MYIYVKICTYRHIHMAPSNLFCALKLCVAGLHTQFDIWHCLEPSSCALVGLVPTEGSEVCSEQSDEARDCKLYIIQTKDCT